MSGDTIATNDVLAREVRLHVFQHVAATARMPSSSEVADAIGQPPAEIEQALRRLAADRLLILAPGTTNVWLAPPFCAVPSDFRVRSCGRTHWAICIWDAMGIPAALRADAEIAARCGASGHEIHLAVRDGELTQSEGIVHFGVPAARWWDNIGFA
jgi:hypothetical protein